MAPYDEEYLEDDEGYSYGPAIPGSSDPVSALFNRKAAEAAAARANQAQALQSLSSNYTGGMEDGISQAILGIMPLLLGTALKGKEGLYHGARGALGGVEFYTNERDKQQKRRDALGIQEVDLYGDKAKAAEASASRLEATDAIKSKYPSKGTTINNQNYDPNAPLPRYIDESLGEKQGFIREAQGVVSYIENVTPEELRKSYRDPKTGKVDKERTWKIVGDELGKLAFGAETDLGKATQRVNNFISQYQHKISGAAASDEEFKRLYGNIMGGGIVPQTLPKALDMIRYLQTMEQKKGADELRRFKLTKSGGDVEAGWNSMTSEMMKDMSVGRSEYDPVLSYEQAVPPPPGPPTVPDEIFNKAPGRYK